MAFPYIYWPSVEQLSGMQTPSNYGTVTNGKVVTYQTFCMGE